MKNEPNQTMKNTRLIEEHLKPVPRRLVSSGSKPLPNRLIKEKRLWCLIEDNLYVYRKLEQAQKQLGSMTPYTKQIGSAFVKVRKAQEATEGIIRSLRALLRDDNA
jgi:hypothetical protein